MPRPLRGSARVPGRSRDEPGSWVSQARVTMNLSPVHLVLPALHGEPREITHQPRAPGRGSAYDDGTRPGLVEQRASFRSPVALQPREPQISMGAPRRVEAAGGWSAPSV